MGVLGGSNPTSAIDSWCELGRLSFCLSVPEFPYLSNEDLPPIGTLQGPGRAG